MKQKRAIFTFGRFNPPTAGHLAMIEAGHKMYPEHDVLIFPSWRHTPKDSPNKNPLPPDIKISVMTSLFSPYMVVSDSSVVSPHHVIPYLAERQYSDVVFIVGSDRAVEFSNRWIPYASEEFDKASVVSTLSRVDENFTNKISATAARVSAINNDITQFCEATGWPENIASGLMLTLQQSMGMAHNGKHRAKQQLESSTQKY